jgi:hypothetical protein
MNKKLDENELSFFSEHIEQQLKFEINSIGHLYKSDKISYLRAQEKLRQASKDIKRLFWEGREMISKEHKKINFLFKVKNSMNEDMTVKKINHAHDDLAVINDDMTVKKISNAHDDLA